MKDGSRVKNKLKSRKGTNLVARIYEEVWRSPSPSPGSGRWEGAKEINLR